MMEQNTQKFRLKLNLFDGIVLVLALAAAAFLLWRTMKPAAPAPADPAGVTASSTVRFTVRFERWAEGTSSLIQAGDQIADNIKNYDVGEVVSAQALPARVRTVDESSRKWVWAEVDGLEDVLVTIQAPCEITDEAIIIGGGYEIRAGSTGYFRGEGYMGSGPIVSVEEVQG